MITFFLFQFLLSCPEKSNQVLLDGCDLLFHHCSPTSSSPQFTTLGYTDYMIKGSSANDSPSQSLLVYLVDSSLRWSVSGYHCHPSSHISSHLISFKLNEVRPRFQPTAHTLFQSFSYSLGSVCTHLSTLSKLSSLLSNSLGDLTRPCGTVLEPWRVREMRTLQAWALALARVHIRLACPLFLRRGPPATIISTVPEDNNTNNTNSRSRPCLGLIIAGNLVPQPLHSDNNIDQLRATITQVLDTVVTAITVTATVTVTVTALTVAKVVTSTTSKAVLLLPRGPLETYTAKYNYRPFNLLSDSKPSPSSLRRCGTITTIDSTPDLIRANIPVDRHPLSTLSLPSATPSPRLCIPASPTTVTVSTCTETTQAALTTSLRRALLSYPNMEIYPITTSPL